MGREGDWCKRARRIKHVSSWLYYAHVHFGKVFWVDALRILGFYFSTNSHLNLPKSSFWIVRCDPNAFSGPWKWIICAAWLSSSCVVAVQLCIEPPGNQWFISWKLLVVLRVSSYDRVLTPSATTHTRSSVTSNRTPNKGENGTFSHTYSVELNKYRCIICEKNVLSLKMVKH